jgi:2-succinyl-5-enolpyruvyl-6-hydroxy-3-cyclohexene-1-carboxylate synthase
MSQPNPSTAQARAIADEFHRHGVVYAVISPGSRSAALAIAFDEHPDIETVVVLDERSAGFHALGRCRVGSAPVVAVCTSGTALANYLPAVVEADLSLLPLIVLSADRPPDLLQIGANQTIDQVGMFGERARWFCNIAPADASRDWNSYWRGSVSQAVARSLGHGSRPGPVHVNVAFREPTVPVTDDGRTTGEPYPHSIEGRPSNGRWQDHDRSWPTAGNMSDLDGQGLIVVGEGEFDPGSLDREAGRLGWPVLATAMSGLRGGDAITTYHHLLVDGVPQSLRPDFVISVGRVGPSDRIGALTSLDVPQLLIDRWGGWNDPRRETTRFLQADPVESLASIEAATGESLKSAWIDADRTMRLALDDCLGEDVIPTGPGVASILSGIDFDRLIAASSMPIRDVDAHTVHRGRVIANRGASGIDGFVSTAIGAASLGGRTLALSGDLSLLHDASGFVTGPSGSVVFVVIDNGGGGLFDLLPQAEHAPGFERLFVTPHGLDLAALASAYGVESSTAPNLDGLAERMDGLLDASRTHLVVVPVDRETDLKKRRALDETARSVRAGLS